MIYTISQTSGCDHHLFQGFLQSQLKRGHRAEQIAELHLQAGEWFAENDSTDESIRHNLRAGDENEVAHLVEQNGQTMLNSDRWYIFEKTHSGDRFFHLL